MMYVMIGWDIYKIHAWKFDWIHSYEVTDLVCLISTLQYMSTIC